MMTTLLATLVLAAAISAPPRTPLVVGYEGVDSADILSITSQAGDRPFWLISVEVHLTGLLVASAYLPPKVSTRTLRRGQVVIFDGPEDRSTHQWTIADTREWGQVADGKRFVSVPEGAPKLRESPFMISGEISDSTLLSLVQFIRSSPSDFWTEHHADGSTTVSGGGSLKGALASITVNTDGTFSVGTEFRSGAGQGARITRERGGWKVTRIVNWVE